MGHSVGAWLLCEVMKREKGVKAGYMLFPTLGWLRETWNGRTLWVSFGMKGVRGVWLRGSRGSADIPSTAETPPADACTTTRPDSAFHLVPAYHPLPPSISCDNTPYRRSRALGDGAHR